MRREKPPRINMSIDEKKIGFAVIKLYTELANEELAEFVIGLKDQVTAASSLAGLFCG